MEAKIIASLSKIQHERVRPFSETKSVRFYGMRQEPHSGISENLDLASPLCLRHKRVA